MLQAVDDFKQFLGPELKAVTGDTSVIEEVSVMVQVCSAGERACLWRCVAGVMSGRFRARETGNE